MFSERYGYVELPAQLKLEEVSKEFRTALWNCVYGDLNSSKILIRRPGSLAGSKRGYGLSAGWCDILQHWHTEYMKLPIDEFDSEYSCQLSDTKGLILDSKFFVVFDFVEHLIENADHHSCELDEITDLFSRHNLAYRVIDSIVIPISSEEHAATVNAAFQTASEQNIPGAKAHLKLASKAIMAKDWAGSIRESIHAVEVVTRRIEPDARTLGSALNLIEKEHGMHPALKQAFSKLYGWTSDESGIRHAIVDEPQGPVDEALALFMHGACASFVTYLLTVYSEHYTN